MPLFKHLNISYLQEKVGGLRTFFQQNHLILSCLLCSNVYSNDDSSLMFNDDTTFMFNDNTTSTLISFFVITP
jgi:hypothetical protein